MLGAFWDVPIERADGTACSEFAVGLCSLRLFRDVLRMKHQGRPNLATKMNPAKPDEPSAALPTAHAAHATKVVGVPTANPTNQLARASHADVPLSAAHSPRQAEDDSECTSDFDVLERSALGSPAPARESGAREDAALCTPVSHLPGARREHSYDSPAADEHTQKAKTNAKSWGESALRYTAHPSCARRLLLVLDGGSVLMDKDETPRLCLDVQITHEGVTPRLCIDIAH